MAMDVNGHLNEEEIEKYSLRVTAEPDLTRIEEHLLVCEFCRKQVEDSDFYVRSMQTAAARSRREAGTAFPWRALLPVAAVLIIGFVLFHRTGQAPLAVVLTATRGGGAGVAARAPQGKRLALQPDTTGLPPAGSYRLEMVDQNGGLVWAGTFPGQPLKPLPAGGYFVRLFSQQGQLLREYALELEPR